MEFKGIKLTIDLDITKYTSAIKKITSTTNSLKKDLDRLRESTKLDPSDTSAYLTYITKLKEQMKDTAVIIQFFKQQLDFEKENNGLKETDSKFILLDNTIKKLEKTYADLYDEFQGNIFKEPSDQAEEFSENVEDADDSLVELKNTGQESLDALKVAFGNLISQGIQKAIGEIKKLVSEVYQIGKESSELTANIKALYGDALSDDQLQRVIDKTRELGQSTEYTANEVMQGVRAMALAGYDANESIQAITATLDLASATGEDVAELSSIVVDGLHAMGYAATDAAKFADVLTVAANETNADVTDLGEAFKYAGAVAGTFGYSVNDLALALGLMAQSGVKGSMAGTSLRQVITRLATNTSGARDAFDALGESFFDSEGNAMEFSKVLVQLREGLGDLSEEEQATILNVIGGQRALSGLSAIVNATEEDFNKLTLALEDCNGIAKQIAETRLDSFYGDVEILQGTLENAALTVFDELEPALRDAAQEITKFLKSASFDKIAKDIAELSSSIVNGLVDAFKFLVTHLNEIKGIIEILLAMKIGISIDNIIGKVTEMSKAFSTLKMSTSSYIAILAGYVAAVKAINDSVEEINYTITYTTAANEQFAESFTKVADNANDSFQTQDLQIRYAETYAEKIDELTQKINDATTSEEERMTAIESVQKYVELFNQTMGDEAVAFDTANNSVLLHGDNIESLTDKYAGLAEEARKAAWLTAHQEEYQQALENVANAEAMQADIMNNFVARFGEVDEKTKNAFFGWVEEGVSNASEFHRLAQETEGINVGAIDSMAYAYANMRKEVESLNPSITAANNSIAEYETVVESNASELTNVLNSFSDSFVRIKDNSASLVEIENEISRIQTLIDTQEALGGFDEEIAREEEYLAYLAGLKETFMHTGAGNALGYTETFNENMQKGADEAHQIVDDGAIRLSDETINSDYITSAQTNAQSYVDSQTETLESQENIDKVYGAAKLTPNKLNDLGSVYSSSGSGHGNNYLNGLLGPLEDAKNIARAYNAAKRIQEAINQGTHDAGKYGSPSKIAIQFGEYYAEGLMIGLENGIKDLKLVSQDVMNGINSTFANAETPRLAGGVVINFSIDNSGKDITDADVSKWGNKIASVVNQKLGMMM